MTFCYPFYREFQTETSLFQKELINVLCILICHGNDKSFNVNSVFTKLMVGKYYCFYCVSWFMWSIKFTLFSSFFSQQAIDSEVKAGAVPSVTVKVRCLTLTVAFE